MLLKKKIICNYITNDISIYSDDSDRKNSNFSDEEISNE